MEIKDYAHELKLPYLKTNYTHIIKEAKELNIGYEEFLKEYLQIEYNARKENGIKRKLRQAKFTTKKYLDNFEIDHFSLENQKKIRELETLDFVENKENVILIGNPGVGNYRKFLIMKRNK